MLVSAIECRPQDDAGTYLSVMRSKAPRLDEGGGVDYGNDCKQNTFRRARDLQVGKCPPNQAPNQRYVVSAIYQRVDTLSNVADEDGAAPPAYAPRTTTAMSPTLVHPPLELFTTALRRAFLEAGTPILHVRQSPNPNPGPPIQFI